MKATHSTGSQTIIVRAFWDGEADVWVATSDDVPGLVAEAATREALRETIMVRIGELLELNGSDSHLPEIPVHILTERTDRIRNPSFAD